MRLPTTGLPVILACLLGFLGAPCEGRCDPPPGGPSLAHRPLPLPQVQVIDLASALRLAGVENRDILLARQRAVEALALRQLAAAQFLPNLNAGLNYDAHTGALQQANGNILSVNRDSLYLGAGSNAVAAGTVNIPGVVYDMNASQTIFNYLSSKQEVARRRYAAAAMTNEMLRLVASAYLDLLKAEGVRSVALQARGEAQVIARVTADFAKVQQGRQADADRARTEFDDRRIDHIEAEAKIKTVSARLAELLNIDPSIRLHPAEERLVPMSIVPDPVPLEELLAIAMMQRPELAERRAAIRQAFLQLSAAKVLPFSPNLIVGLSGGTFGGGSNVATAEPRFGSFASREDLDAVIYWTVQNMGVGNVALIRLAASHTRSANLEHLQVLTRVRFEVAQAYVRKQTFYEKMLLAEKAVPIGVRALTKDFERVNGGVGLPIELLESFRLTNQARFDYLDAIVGYNQAQLDLYVALGQPPADALARPVPTTGVRPSKLDNK
jgi:outer membrane protein TolC